MPAKKVETSLKLMRHLLGSIDLSDFEENLPDLDKNEKPMTEIERRDYCAAIFAVWPRLEKDIKKFMMIQLMYSSNNSQDWGQVLFARGSFNGMDLLFDHWKQASAEFQASNLDKQPDPNNPVSEL